MKWSTNNHEKLTSISCFTSFFNVRISLSCIQMLLIQWWKLSLDVVSYTFLWITCYFFSCLIHLTYLHHLPTWLTYPPDIPTCISYLTYLYDQLTWPTYPIYLSTWPCIWLELVTFQIFAMFFFVHSCILHKSDKKSIFGKHYYRLMCKAHLFKSRKLG